MYTYLSEIVAFINDGHVNLYTPFGYARCRNCNVEYTSMRLLNSKKYIAFNQSQKNKEIIQYGDVIGENIGYIMIKTFNGTSEDERFLMIDGIISEFYDKAGILIDVRGNGGGNSSNADIIAGRFADVKRVYRRFCNKTGRGANDFSDWESSYIEPRGKKQFLKPVVIMTSRRTFSSSEDFVLAMKVFPHVTQIGDTTSGGIGNPVFRELPNGWNYRLSTKVVATPDGHIVEGNGIPPDFTILNSETDSIAEIDRMLEKGIEIIKSLIE